MCKKQKHIHRLEAKGQALSLMRAPYFKGGKVTVYKCPDCGFFHISVKKNK